MTAASMSTIAPVIAGPRKRAGRVKTAQRRRAVLTRPSDSKQSNARATVGGASQVTE